jgi:hypothetical protein
VAITSFLLHMTMFLNVGSAIPKYAVLVGAQTVDQDNQSGDSDVWLDLVSQYKMLVNIGFKQDNIFVLYGSGDDFNSDYDEFKAYKQFKRKITRAAPTRESLGDTFTAIGKAMTKPGYLYVWWMGHGKRVPNSSDPCSVVMVLEFTDEEISGSELRSWMDRVTMARRKDLFVETCFGEGIIKAFNASRDTIALAAAGCNELSTDLFARCNGLPHAEFSFWENAAIRSKDLCEDPSAAQRDAMGRLSLAEIRRYAWEKMTKYSKPRICDPLNLADQSFLDDTDPLLLSTRPGPAPGEVAGGPIGNFSISGNMPAGGSFQPRE